MISWPRLVLFLAFTGCASSSPKAEHPSPYRLDPADSAAFPERGGHPSPGSACRISGTVQSSKADEASTDEFSYVRRVSSGDSGLKFDWKVEKFKRDQTKAGAHAVWLDTKILPSVKLSATVNCTTQKVVDKAGFPEALRKIEKAGLAKEERDFLIGSLRGLVQAAADTCHDKEGPFDLHKVAGQKPGYQWKESVPIMGFESSKVDERFLGWHEKDGQRFAVLEAHLDSAGRFKSEGAEIGVQMTLENYTLVSADQKKIIRDATTAQTVSTAGELPISGRIKIDMVTDCSP